MNPMLSDAIRAAVELLPPPRRPDDLEAQVVAYVELLLNTNARINLVSRRDTETHVARFTHECLFLAQRMLEDAQRVAGRDEPIRLLDLGSGGGFPGILLKLALPDVECTLVESTRKKALFLAEACKSLNLKKITIISGRAEDLASRRGPMYRPEFRHLFDWVTAKALGSLLNSTRLALPFLSVGGVHWTFKGRGYREELRSCERLMRQSRLKRHVIEAIPGDAASWIVAVRRLEQRAPKAHRGAESNDS